MMLAPTNEMAIGMKSSDFGIDSRFIRSMSSASIRPSAVAAIGAISSQRMVLTSTCRVSGSVKAQS